MYSEVHLIDVIDIWFGEKVSISRYLKIYKHRKFRIGYLNCWTSHSEGIKKLLMLADFQSFSLYKFVTEASVITDQYIFCQVPRALSKTGHCCECGQATTRNMLKLFCFIFIYANMVTPLDHILR